MLGPFLPPQQPRVPTRSGLASLGPVGPPALGQASPLSLPPHALPPAPLPALPLSPPSVQGRICQLWEESAAGCPALLASRGPWDGATPVLGEPGGCKGERRPCTGMAWGLGQDTGRARVSPVSTRGFPDPCPGIVCLRMSHCRAPGSHPSQLPWPAPPCPPANRCGTAQHVPSSPAANPQRTPAQAAPLLWG